MRLFTRTETVTTTDDWGTPVTRTVTHLSTFEARRQRRIIAKLRADVAAREAAHVDEW